MPHSSKRKGNRHEREIIEVAEEHGFDAERAWGSDGRAMGESKEVDNLIESEEVSFRVSAKRRKNIANYLTPPEGADALVVREDYGDNLVVMPLTELLEILRKAYLESNEQ